ASIPYCHFLQKFPFILFLKHAFPSFRVCPQTGAVPKDPADVYCGGRVPRARLLPLESPPPFSSANCSEKTYSPIKKTAGEKAFLSGCFILETYGTAPF